jgi:aminotransferase
MLPVSAARGSDAFGPSGEGHVRACYATSSEELDQALVRMERFLGSL